MKKNITVGMPLAVPTQKRPPGKYASHPYPALDVILLAINASMIGVGSMLETTRDNTAVSAKITGTGIFKSVYISFNLQPEYLDVIAKLQGAGTLTIKEKPKELKYSESVFTMVSANVSGLGALKKVYIIHNAGRELVGITATFKGLGELV